MRQYQHAAYTIVGQAVTLLCRHCAGGGSSKAGQSRQPRPEYQTTNKTKTPTSKHNRQQHGNDLSSIPPTAPLPTMPYRNPQPSPGLRTKQETSAYLGGGSGFLGLRLLGGFRGLRVYPAEEIDHGVASGAVINQPGDRSISEMHHTSSFSAEISAVHGWHGSTYLYLRVTGRHLAAGGIQQQESINRNKRALPSHMYIRVHRQQLQYHHCKCITKITRPPNVDHKPCFFATGPHGCFDLQS